MADGDELADFSAQPGYDEVGPRETALDTEWIASSGSCFPRCSTMFRRCRESPDATGTSSSTTESPPCCGRRASIWKQRLQPDKGHYVLLDRYAAVRLEGGRARCDEIDGARATCMVFKACESIWRNEAVEISGEDYSLPLRRS